MFPESLNTEKQTFPMYIALALVSMIKGRDLSTKDRQTQNKYFVTGLKQIALEKRKDSKLMNY